MNGRDRLLVALLGVLAAGLIVVLAVQTWSALGRISRASEDRARTLARTIVSSVAGVVRHGADREGRVYAILEEISRDPHVLTIGILEEDASPVFLLGQPPDENLLLPRGDRFERIATEEDRLTLVRRLDVQAGCMAPGGCSCGPGTCTCGGGPSRLMPAGLYHLVLVIDTASSSRVEGYIVAGAVFSGLILVMLALVAGLLVRSVRGRDRLAREVALEKQRSRSLESMGHLAAGLAHETRNPLGAIRGYAQLLHEQSGDEEARERTAVIIRELDRVGEKLEEFLGFARKRNLEKELTDLATVARETVMLVQPDADARGVDLDVSASPSVSPIDADPRQLKELMLNLVLNAVQACDEGGSVQVRVDGGHGGPVVRVVDSGAGIAVDDAPRIFEPYFTTREDGSGMGLAISRRIAEDHGALLTVQGSPGGGAEARLEFGRGDKGGA